MRYLLTSLVLLTLLVLSPASEGQEKPKLQKLVSPLVGTWVSKSDAGSTMVRYRKDGWFISAHYFSASFSLSESVWAVGHWALADDSLILHRLAGSDGLQLVPEKRQLVLKELTPDKLRLASVPLGGQTFEKMEDIPAPIESHLSGATLKKQVYEQKGLILPEDAKKDVESYVSIFINQGRTMQYYLSPGGEFLGSIGEENDDLIGKWEKSGDFLIVSGITEKRKVAILMELKKIDGRYKIFNMEANGMAAPDTFKPTPFQKITPVKLSADGATQYLNVETFNDWYAKLNSMTEVTGVRKQVTAEGKIEETPTSSKSIFKADSKTGAVKGMSKMFEEDGYYMVEVDGQYDAFLGVSFSKSRSTKLPDSYRYRIGVISKLEPRTLRWFFTSGVIPKTDEYFSEQVMNSTGGTSKTTVKRDGEFFLEFNSVGKRTADFDEEVWAQFNVAAKALIEKTKDESPAQQE